MISNSDEDIDVGPEIPGVALISITWPKGNGPAEFKIIYDNTAVTDSSDIDKEFVDKFYASMKARREEGETKMPAKKPSSDVSVKPEPKPERKRAAVGTEDQNYAAVPKKQKNSNQASISSFFGKKG